MSILTKIIRTTFCFEHRVNHCLTHNKRKKQQNASKQNFQLKNLVICFECYVEIPENQIILPCCNQIVHKKFIQQEMISTENLKCYFCQILYDMNFLKQILVQKFSKKNQKISITQMLLIHVLIAKLKFKFYQNKRKKFTYQNVAIESFSQRINNRNIIKYLKFQEIRQEIIQFLQGQSIIICPFCDLIQTKDDGCNHVTCHHCKYDLCSECSVDRRPILQHGNHFHRKGCIDYSRLVGKKNMTKEKLRNCQQCKKVKMAIVIFLRILRLIKKKKDTEFNISYSQFYLLYILNGIDFIYQVDIDILKKKFLIMKNVIKIEMKQYFKNHIAFKYQKSLIDQFQSTWYINFFIFIENSNSIKNLKNQYINIKKNVSLSTCWKLNVLNSLRRQLARPIYL
ncbi:unnamed protein product [Paramecium sonneborni]|uniref:RING-type domain-containing protein n=1 Tax=Paramecium sonneborni TaxID=65129 RepID=A0A8S1PH92_9CILI|nr:unnamed protein product [Paramecium sonneborni]